MLTFDEKLTCSMLFYFLLTENKMSSFFIHTQGVSQIITLMKEVFSEYWDENDFLINYFLIEHLVTMLSDVTKKKKEECQCLEMNSE